MAFLRRLLNLISAAAAAAVPALCGGTPPGSPPLRPDATIEIAGVAGKFDFLEIDAVRHRLLGAHEVAGTADFFDLKSRRVLARVATGPAVHVAVDPKNGDYFVSASDEKKVVIVDSATFRIVGSIPTDGELDAIVFDPKNRRIFVTEDNGSHVWAIDADGQKVVAAIALPGKPEYMIYDPGADRIYLNLKSTDEVAMIDPGTNSVVARWSTAPATAPHGLALDPLTGRLFAAGTNGRLAVIDIKSGRVIAAPAIPAKVDQDAFDPSTRRVYCACTGWMAVAQETDDGAVFLGKVPAPDTAKNVAVDPETHAVWTTYTDGRNSYAKSWRP